MREQNSWWRRLAASYVEWSPWIAGYLLAFFVIFFAGAFFSDLGEFLTNQATIGWAAAIASAGAAIIALAVASKAREQSERERSEDRKYNSIQRREDRDYAEKLRLADAELQAAHRSQQARIEAQRITNMAGIQMAVYLGHFYRAKAAFTGIKQLLSEDFTDINQREIAARLNSMIANLQAVPIATAYEYDPKLGAHLSYILDWVHGMELGNRGHTHDHRRHVKKGAHSIGDGINHVEVILKRIQVRYRDAHLTDKERGGYIPPDIP